MAVTKKQKKETDSSGLSVNEFKSWISGVEDMQGSDWCPTKEQWKKIREKIGLLAEGTIQQNSVQYHQSPVYRTEQQWPVNTPINNTSNGAPAPLYSEIDLNKQPDIIAGEYKPAFM